MTKRPQRKPPLHRLARELRQWCEDHGLSQSALAMRLGVSTSHLNQIIRGRARPSVALLRRIMVVLHGPKPQPQQRGRPAQAQETGRTKGRRQVSSGSGQKR